MKVNFNDQFRGDTQKLDQKSMKYKPCCGSTCLLAHCETRDHGGCYCICRLIDHIESLKDTIASILIEEGSIYIPNPEKRAFFLYSMSSTQKEKHKEFKENKAPKLLAEAEERLKGYLI